MRDSSLPKSIDDMVDILMLATAVESVVGKLELVVVVGGGWVGVQRAELGGRGRRGDSTPPSAQPSEESVVPPARHSSVHMVSTLSSRTSPLVLVLASRKSQAGKAASRKHSSHCPPIIQLLYKTI